MKKLIRVFSFVLIFSLLFVYVSTVLARKEVIGAWNMSIKINGFFNEPKDSIDVMGFGSSHMYCSINPLLLNNDTGITSYLLCTQQQPIWATYYYIKEALKVQNPKVILVDLFMLIQEEPNMKDAVAHDAIDYLRWSPSKVELIENSIKPEEKKNFYLRFLKYHSRWQELKENDFEDYAKEKDWLKGYVFLTQSKPIVLDREIVQNAEVKEPIEKSKEYLQKIIDLSKKEDFELVFIVSPYKVEEKEQPIFNYVKGVAKEQDIKFIDFNLICDELELDGNTDFYDAGHVNYLGTQKITEYLEKYLQENFEFNKKAPVWSKEYKEYLSRVIKMSSK